MAAKNVITLVTRVHCLIHGAISSLGVRDAIRRYAMTAPASFAAAPNVMKPKPSPNTCTLRQPIIPTMPVPKPQ